ncbi:phosphopantetheine-binding protein [uncultured Microbacterium sp.]|uniref:phosphopantetheine-binding protein n=1 Tax=uncultured Microbacterium sp. TaxID=191216 RepID=UPI0026382D54|nr:phosphopantetheine-binding protein [uncultured Microbacterium sp.]
MSVNVNSTTVERVTGVIATTLDIADRADTLDVHTELFGVMPELDSLALLELAAALEEEFGFVIGDEDFTEEVFSTIGSLSQFVDERRT